MSTARTRVAVIGGGANAEHEVSLASAAAVRAHLPASAYDVVPLTICPDGAREGVVRPHRTQPDNGSGHRGRARPNEASVVWRDAGGHPLGIHGAMAVLSSCDVVFPALHGAGGEDGTIAALCTLAGLPCVGSPAAAGAIAMDKHLTKLVATDAGVRVASGVLLDRTSAYEWEGPVVVKPASAGSSRGVSLVERPDELAVALKEAFSYDDRVLVEEVVVGREIDIAVFGSGTDRRLVAPPLEIVGPGVFDYDTKYGGGADLRVPADVTRAERRSLRDTAVRMYDALGCRGLARIDFFLTEDPSTGSGGTGPVLLEVNTMPGLTEHSQAPRMFAAAGISYPELLDLMVRDALR